MDDPQYLIWREKIAPLIYDWFAHHNLPWPTQACRFGQVIEDLTYKTRYRIYYSEQTDDSEPQKLIVSSADVCKPGVASAEVVASWTDFSKSPYLKEQKIIFHPGEVNKIREVPAYPHLVITHSDAPEVYVWNVDKQPSRSRTQGYRGKSGADSIPDLLLIGHDDEALFPLATTPAGPAVASGGNDCQVLVWDLNDHITSLLAGTIGGSAGIKNPPQLKQRSKLTGHTRAVEEVVFKPGSVQELASVGDDYQLLFWDCRTGSKPVRTMPDAHGPQQDVQCVDWSALAEHCVATGAQDGSVKVWDLRALRGPDDTLATLRCHTDAIIRLEWHPHAKGILASGGDDKVVMLWRIDPDAAPGVGHDQQQQQRQGAAANTRQVAGARKGLAGDRHRPSELIMQHSGHRRGKVVDFQWCPTVPWAIMSVSDDSLDEDVGGGSLQMWRPSELLYGDEKTLLAQLEQHRDWIMNGRNGPAPAAPLLMETSKEEQAAAAAAAAAAVAVAPSSGRGKASKEGAKEQLASSTPAGDGTAEGLSGKEVEEDNVEDVEMGDDKGGEGNGVGEQGEAGVAQQEAVIAEGDGVEGPAVVEHSAPGGEAAGDMDVDAPVQAQEAAGSAEEPGQAQPVQAEG